MICLTGGALQSGRSRAVSRFDRAVIVERAVGVGHRGVDRRPYDPSKLNYIPVMIIALPASLVLGRHLLALLYMR